jgi:hypothetical protein
VIESGSDWAFGGPTVIVPFRPESNGFVAVDTVDRVWPDDMGDPEDGTMVFGAWSMGHFGPFAFPGNLERATQQSWHWEEGKTAPLGHRAFLRVRCSYVFGVSDDSPILPSDYEPLDELLFITTVARDLLSLPSSICYFNPNGEVLSTSEGIDELMKRQHVQDLLPQELWVNVRLFNLTGHEPWVLMDTVGMWQLDVPDHEAAFRSDIYEPSDVALFLRNAADYVLHNGQIISDDDTMDGPGQIRWQAKTFEDPVCSPPRQVLRWLPCDNSAPPSELTSGQPQNDDA